ncbi:MAG: hypothetical protein IJ237_06335, partial [Oscillospiraceae bacterium]|nr:hypothetical protein [Oscillospiraceae bacterium]
VIKCIRDGETYQELPWPVVAEKLFQTKSPEMLAEILLNQPMSEKEEYKALKEDYHLLPDLYSVTMLKMVRRAMQGEDPELATMLLLMAGYGDQLMEFIQKIPLSGRRFCRMKKKSSEKTTGGKRCTSFLQIERRGGSSSLKTQD